MRRDREKATSGAGGARGNSRLRSCGIKNRASELLFTAIRITWWMGELRCAPLASRCGLPGTPQYFTARGQQ